MVRQSEPRANGKPAGPRNEHGRNHAGDMAGEDRSVDVSEPAQPRGLVGFVNLGNTCFMNAALQSVLNCEPLVAYLQDCVDFVNATTPRHHSVVDSYIGLNDAYWAAERPSTLSPHELLHDIRTVNPMFRGYQQHDSQEFIGTLLDKLHTEMASITHQHVFTDISCLPVGSLPGTPHDSNSIVSTPRASVRGPRGLHRLAQGTDSEDSSVDELHSFEQGGDRLKGGDRMSGDVADGVGKKTTRPKIVANGKPEPLNNIHKAVTQFLFNEKGACHQRRPGYRKHSIISDLFEGIERSQVTCRQCGRESFKYDPFMSVLIEIGRCAPDVPKKRGWWQSVKSWVASDDPITLSECLDRYTKVEHLDQYLCDHCGEECNSTKTLRFQAMPEVLIIMLKRFHHDSHGSGKISTPVSFPLDGLDMQPFLVETPGQDWNHRYPQATAAGRAWPNATSPDATDCTYNLTAIVDHRGGMGGGHYVAYARNFSNQQWYEYDDSRVRHVSAADVAQVEAYVLLYQRDATAQAQERKRIFNLLLSTPSTVDDDVYFISRQWFHRLMTFAHPGPINNRDVCCEHGGVNAHLANHATRFFVRVNGEVYKYLHAKHGGGPAVQQLSTCIPCEIAHDVLQKRRRQERDDVDRLKASAQDGSAGAWYMVPTRWYSEWRSFVRSHHPDQVPPGPIEMHHITKEDGTPMRNLRSGAHYHSFSEQLWDYLVDIYGICGQPLRSPIRSAY